MPVRAFGDDAFPLIVAHRGSSSTHPENTLPSFAAAIEVGAPVVELDVRLTADGVPVVLHDPDVERTTDGTGLVHELTSAQVSALEAGTPAFPARVPTLGEALRLLSGRAAVAIEIKNIPGEPSYQPDGESIVESALGELRRVDFDGPVLVLSFNPRSIEVAKDLGPEVATGFLTGHVDPRDGLVHVVEAGHDMLLPGSFVLASAGAGFVAEAHDAGVRLGTWTVDDAPSLTSFLRWGVDAVASNDPAMGLEALAAYRASI